MKILWHMQVPVDEIWLKQMNKAASQALVCEKVLLPCSIAVCLCDDATIAAFNQKYRGISASTDVLSFPTVEYSRNETAGQCEQRLRMEYDDETDACFLGDIMISVPHIKAQAWEYGHSEVREACYLLVHGLCHLMGYDHMQPDEKEKMRTMEEKILASVNVTRETSLSLEDQELLQLAREAMQKSYSPYSSFPVGAALHSKDGRIFLGCNVENASFGLTNCAERTAVFKAVSEGVRAFDVIAIAAKAKAWPCGACRQVLNEFAPGIRILVTWEDQVEEMNLNELLPESFGPRSMNHN